MGCRPTAKVSCAPQTPTWPTHSRSSKRPSRSCRGSHTRWRAPWKTEQTINHKQESQMKIARFAITGNGAMLQHNPISMRASTGAIERGGKKIPLPYDEAKAGLYALPSGQLYVKSDWFREAGLIAASEVKDPTRKGRATLTRRFSASVFLCTDHCPLYRASDLKKPITSNDE